MAGEAIGRPNQRSRTRKDLLLATARLLKQGRKPTLEEVAEEAMVSRATAYRYFPSVDALLVEAPLEGAVPDPDELFRDVSSDDPVERLERVDTVLQQMIADNEPALRMMLSSSLQHSVSGDDSREIPVRQNRRTALIEAALFPVRKQFRPGMSRTLAHALALIIGTESTVVFKDVLGVDETDARKVRRWAIRALVDAARKS